jgi:exodeoxyribonuclease-3
MDLLKKLAQLENPDIICVQEVKAKESDFPFADIEALGFPHIALYSQAGYNGVAILSKIPFNSTCEKNWVGKRDARHICVNILDDVEIHNIYIPSGGDIPDPIGNLSFAHKLAFMDDISEYFEKNRDELAHKKMIICGDFNVAPGEFDVWGHKQMQHTVSHTPIEVERITRLYNSLDFVDVMRKFYPEPQKIYSWWSYRNPRWLSNDKGRRIDHIWCTKALDNQFVAGRFVTEARKWDRPSDHVPVVAEMVFNRNSLSC